MCMINMIDCEVSIVSLSFLLISLHEIDTIFHLIINDYVTHFHALIIRGKLFPATTVNSLSIAS